MTLSEVKHRSDLLLAVLGRDKPGRHLKCPWHEEQHGSLSVWQGTDGVWLWKCHAGCGSGTIIDAAMRAYDVKSAADALRAVEQRLGLKIGRDEDYIEPRIDVDRAEHFIKLTHERLLSDFEVQEKYLAGKRGITDLTVVEKYRLGWAERASFRGWHSWRFTGWVIPITDSQGDLRAVRLHSEGRRSRDMPKCLWAPFGTYPSNKPKHGTITLWPPPEEWRGADRLFLNPGELKALAMIAAGYASTSVTSGEGKKFPSRFASRLSVCRPVKVFVVYDDDETGIQWRDAAIKGLESIGLSCASFNYSDRSPDAEQPATTELKELDAEWREASRPALQGLFRRYNRALPGANAGEVEALETIAETTEAILELGYQPSDEEIRFGFTEQV